MDKLGELTFQEAIQQIIRATGLNIQDDISMAAAVLVLADALRKMAHR